MKIYKSEQLDFNTLDLQESDVLIAASGFESRSVTITQHFLNKMPKMNIYVFSFMEKYSNSNYDNDNYFQSINATIINTKGNSDSDVLSVFKVIISDLVLQGQPRNKIFIDISSMSRVWYGSIISYLNLIDLECKLDIVFLYSLAAFESPVFSPDTKRVIEPLGNFINIDIADKPTMLIVGLGYDKYQAYSLKESLDAEEILLFCTDRESSNDYFNEVQIQNRDLLSRVNSNNVIYYPLNDIKYTEDILYGLCTRMSENYRIILAPCGPKLFTLLSFIIANRIDGIDIWKISSFGKIDGNTHKRISNGSFLAYKISY